MDIQNILIRKYTQGSTSGMLFTHEKEKKKKIVWHCKQVINRNDILIFALQHQHKDSGHKFLLPESNLEKPSHKQSYKIGYRKHLCASTSDNAMASLGISNKRSMPVMLFTKEEMGWLEVSQTFGIPQATLGRKAWGKNKHVLENQKGLGQFKVTQVLV